MGAIADYLLKRRQLNQSANNDFWGQMNTNFTNVKDIVGKYKARQQQLEDATPGNTMYNYEKDKAVNWGVEKEQKYNNWLYNTPEGMSIFEKINANEMTKDQGMKLWEAKHGTEGGALFPYGELLQKRALALQAAGRSGQEYDAHLSRLDTDWQASIKDLERLQKYWITDENGVTWLNPAMADELETYLKTLFQNKRGYTKADYADIEQRIKAYIQTVRNKEVQVKQGGATAKAKPSVPLNPGQPGGMPGILPSPKPMPLPAQGDANAKSGEALWNSNSAQEIANKIRTLLGNAPAVFRSSLVDQMADLTTEIANSAVNLETLQKATALINSVLATMNKGITK